MNATSTRTVVGSVILVFCLIGIIALAERGCQTFQTEKLETIPQGSHVLFFSGGFQRGEWILLNGSGKLRGHEFTFGDEKGGRIILVGDFIITR